MMIYILIGGLLVFIYLALVIWAVVKRSKGKFSGKDQQYIYSHWYRILDSFKHDPRHAIMDADKLLDYCLRKRGGGRFDKMSLGEKLKKSEGYFSDLNGVWSAHKVRNKIAHELNLKLSERDAKIAISQFKKALKDLGAEL
jgi:hypothetical protein